MSNCKLNVLVIFLYCFALPLAHAGQCNAADLDFWKNEGGYFSFEDQAEAAGKRTGLQSCPDCTVEEFFPLAFPIISEEFPQYSQPCQDCWNGLVSCVRIVCFTKCVDAYFSDTSTLCKTCAESFCNPTFHNCSGTGFNLLSCPDCIEPKELDLVPILAGIGGVVVASIIGFVGVRIYQSYKYGPSADELAQEQLADMGILVKVDESQPAPQTRADEVNVRSGMVSVENPRDTFPDNYNDNREFGTTPEELFPNGHASTEFVPMEVPEDMENSLSVMDDDENADIF